MKREVIINGARAELNLDRSGDTARFVYRRDGSEIRRTASILECEPGIYSILIDGRSYEAKVVARAQAVEVEIAGYRTMIEVRDPRAMSRGGSSAGREGRQDIAAPMPGKVVRVLVEIGTQVEAGGGLVVVEAMKMQNEIKAPKAGTVVQVNVQAGATVGAGQVLVVIE